MQVTITGGAGFIGANLCRRLTETPHVEKVVVLDDLSTGAKENLEGLDVELVEGTILEPADVSKALEGSQKVVHLAARPSVPRSLADPLASHEANATGTVNVLQGAREAGGVQVVLASSSSVYGANPAIPKHEGLVPMPMSPYAVSKLATEQYALAYQHSFGLPVLPFRFFNVFGPLQAPGHAYAAVVPAFVAAALAGEPLPLNGDGEQSRDFTFVDTVTEVIADALLRGVTSDQPVNLAFGTRTDLRSLIALLEELLGRSLEIDQRPPRTGDVRHSQADDSNLRALFPDVVPVDLREGLERTVSWMSKTAP